jgi:hypothetical protein
MREAHVLCVRLLFPFAGKTFVQGQPAGCILYTIPNVQFSERHCDELRHRSGRSPDDFALAVVTRDWPNLKIPATAVWTNHPLLEWAALRCSGLHSSANRTNALATNSALELVRLAQSTDETNGSLWLAEALVLFDAQRDDEAIAALRTAAEKNTWSDGGENDFRYLSSLYQRAGFSELDAALEANISRADIFTLDIQGRIKAHLQRLMTDAIDSTNDSRFSALLNLLVELRKADWPARNVNLQNAFRFFVPADELLEAMRSRLNLKTEPSDDYVKQQEFQQKVFHDYLAFQTDQAVASRFWGQADMAQTEKKLRKEIRERFLFRRVMVAVVGADVSGGCAALFLYLFVIAMLQELPFTWLRKMNGVQGKWPRQPKFWIWALAMLAVGIALGRNFFLTLGLFNVVGLQAIDSSARVSASTEAFLMSIALCGVLFAAQFSIWKFVKKSENRWSMALVSGCAYFIAIAAMAYWRHQTVEAVSLGIG